MILSGKTLAVVGPSLFLQLVLCVLGVLSGGSRVFCLSLLWDPDLSSELLMTELKSLPMRWGRLVSVIANWVARLVK